MHATVSIYMGAANPKLQLRTGRSHLGTMLTGDCGGCHTTVNWKQRLAAGRPYAEPTNQGCTVCHTAAPTKLQDARRQRGSPHGIGSGCITCHAAPNAAPKVFYLNFTPKAAAGLAPPHIPTSSTPCESCHAISFTSFSGTTMSAAKHTTMLAMTGGTCDQCHDLNTLKFYGVNNLTTRPNGHHVGKIATAATAQQLGRSARRRRRSRRRRRRPAVPSARWSRRRRHCLRRLARLKLPQLKLPATSNWRGGKLLRLKWA